MSVEFTKKRTYDETTDSFVYRVTMTAEAAGALSFEGMLAGGVEAQGRLINELFEALVSNTILDLEALQHETPANPVA